MSVSLLIGSVASLWYFDNMINKKVDEEIASFKSLRKDIEKYQLFKLHNDVEYSISELEQYKQSIPLLRVFFAPETKSDEICYFQGTVEIEKAVVAEKNQ